MQGHNGVFIALMFACSVASADIYRSVDAYGNVEFSDRSHDIAEKVELDTKFYRYRVRLKRVIDGDTLELESGEKVRLIGINTPEVASRFTEQQAGGQDAKKWLKGRLGSPDILLEYGEQLYDKYDRLLAHCFLENGDYINARLLEMGHAMLTLTPPNLRYAERLIAAQKQAENKRLGIWSMPAYQSKALTAFTPGISYRGWQRWQLTVKAISQGKQNTQLLVTENLSIQIPNQQLSLFDAMESYVGTPLEVRGWVSRRGDQHIIKLVHPSAIILL